MASVAPIMTLAIACGGASAPAQSPQAGQPAVLASPSAPQSPDLSPAPEPDTLMLVARWQNPAASIATLSRWTGLPITSNTVASAIGGELAQALADDAPVDVAVMLPPVATADPNTAPWIAVSAPLKSLAAAHSAAQARGGVTEVGPGLYRLGPAKHDPSDPTCYIAPAVGKAQTRLVCGPHDKDTRELLPFLTRTMPQQKYGGGDVHLEVRVPVLQKMYGADLTQALRAGAVMLPKRISIGEPTFDRAVERAAVALAEEVTSVVKDADLVTLDLDLREQAADLAVATRFRGHDSWAVGTFMSDGQRQAPAPAAFWKLPRSATAALFSQSSDPARHHGIMLLLGEMLEGWLRHEGAAAADRARVTQLFQPSRITGAAMVAAWGDTGPSGSGGTKRDAGSSAAGPNAAAKLAPGLELSPTSYWLLRIEDAKQPMQTLRDLADATNRPAIKKLLESRLQGRSPIVGLGLRSVPPPAGLLKASLDLEITALVSPGSVDSLDASARNDGKGKHPPSTQPAKATAKTAAHVMAMTDGGGTWLALGTDPSVLTKVLLATQNPGGDDRLKGEPELARLESEKLAGGGYFTLRSLANPAVGGALVHKRSIAKDVANMLDMTPHRGATPILYTFGISNDGPLTITSAVHLPKPAIEDLAVAIGSSLANQFGRLSP